jgi:hypothetical protein
MKRLLSLSLTFILLLAINVKSVSASGEYVRVVEFATGTCTAGDSAAGTVTHVNGLATNIRFTLTNQTRSTLDSITYTILTPGTYPFSIVVPDGTQVTDSMAMTIELLDAGSTVLASDTLFYICGHDLRINLGHGDLYVVLYNTMDSAGKPALAAYCVHPAAGDVRAYGTFGFHITQKDFNKSPAKPAKNTKVFTSKQCGILVTAYVLTTGEYQINIGADRDGKLESIIFKGLPPTDIYFKRFQ